MKILSISEFKGLCNKLSPSEFIISTDNQRADLSECGIKCSFTFPTMVIASNPSSICFRDKNNSYIKLERIKHIKKCEDSLLGKVFDIICTGFLDTNKEFSYTVIVR